MSCGVTVKQTEPMTVAFVSRKGPYSEINECFGQLFGWITEKGYTPAGPPMGVYFNSPEQLPPEELMWELCTQLEGNIDPVDPNENGLGVKVVEGKEVATIIHKGPHNQVGMTYGELVLWLMENDYEVAGPSEEVYLSDPANTSAEERITEVRFPIRKRQG